MPKIFAKILAGAGTLAAISLSAPAEAATATAQVNASVIKPLGLTSTRDMAFGSLLLGTGTWSNETVSITQTGTLTCPTDVTCSGTVTSALFKVSGSNNMTVSISAPDVTMVNAANSSQTIVMHPNAPASVAVNNSGPNGATFGVGGSMTLSSTTPDGDYSGTLTVTVNYQ
jgi:hypothetical protein